MANHQQITIGRHVSVTAPDYLLGAAKEAIANHYNSFMIYIGSPRSSFRNEVSALKSLEFTNYLLQQGLSIDNIVVHGSYLINLANTVNHEKLSWSVEFLERELNLMNEVGLKTIVLHPGSSLGVDKSVALLSVAKALNQVLNTEKTTRIALETMAGRTNELGATFDDLKFIIENVEQTERVGVCWDTCHMYSAGYDIKEDLDSVLEEFKRKIGFDKLWVIHINDSLYGINSRKDRHENVGKGQLGFSCLQKIVHHPLLRKAVKLLETPRRDSYYKDEVRLLMMPSLSSE